jgi:hypothetical protein
MEWQVIVIYCIGAIGFLGLAIAGAGHMRKARRLYLIGNGVMGAALAASGMVTLLVAGGPIGLILTICGVAVDLAPLLKKEGA